MNKLSQLGFVVLLVIVSTIWVGCGDDMPGKGTTANDQFDRSVMLTHWADGFIIPGYKEYLKLVDSLDAQTKRFVAEPNTTRLNNVRSTYRLAYNAWQEVSMFEIGKAEELAFRNQTNIYPANTTAILENIFSESYNLNLPSTIAEQGYPAVEFLIYGLDGSEDAIVEQFILDPKFGFYLEDLTTRLSALTREVYTDWITGYREVFIADDGSSASSSVNRMVNDYLLYYERFLRGGKIAIPAGVFSGGPLANSVEALYTQSPTINKSLYLNSLNNFKAFFDGNSKYIGSGTSLSHYLDYIRELTDGADIRGALDTELENAITVSLNLDEDLYKQVLEDNSKMLETYNQLQKITVLLKTDMFSSLNISVDYVDSDGD